MARRSRDPPLFFLDQTPHLSPPVFLATNYTASKRASRREAAAHYFHRITLCTPSLLLLALTSLASNSFGGTIGSGRRRQRKKERREDRGGRGGISLSTSWEWSCSRRDGGGGGRSFLRERSTDTDGGCESNARTRTGRGVWCDVEISFLLTVRI